jgi:hypothetical protein
MESVDVSHAVPMGTLLTIEIAAKFNPLVERTDACTNARGLADSDRASGWLASNRGYALESTNKRRVLVEVGRGLMDDSRRVALVGCIVFAMGAFALPDLRDASPEITHNFHAFVGD